MLSLYRQYLYIIYMYNFYCVWNWNTQFME